MGRRRYAVVLTETCHVVAVAPDAAGSSLRTFSRNDPTPLATASEPWRIAALRPTRRGGHVVYGGAAATLRVRRTHDLHVCHDVSLPGASPCTCLCFHGDSQYLLVGRGDGSIAVVARVAAPE